MRPAQLDFSCSHMCSNLLKSVCTRYIIRILIKDKIILTMANHPITYFSWTGWIGGKLIK